MVAGDSFGCCCCADGAPAVVGGHTKAAVGVGRHFARKKMATV